jgi:hypothetical protein
MNQRKITIYSILLTSLSAFAQITDPKATEIWEPQPRIVTPGVNSAAPSDAIVIFDGKDLANFSSLDGSAAKWDVKDGIFTVVKGTGDIKTKQAFGSIQLHIEWRTPDIVDGEGQGRGNSGIFLMERYELQVLDNYNNKTYANGQAGSIYKQTMPLVNACKKPGEWQVYDVIFSAPKFNKDGQIIFTARITALHNGILIQNNTEIKGPSEYIGLPVYKAHDKAPIKLQDHGNPISYRNIWIREIE